MIYTKTGDAGTTSLVGGTRVGKDDTRVEAYGTIDELNAYLALLAEQIFNTPYSSVLKEIQNDLFVVQTLLATPDAAMRSTLPPLTEARVGALELQIDNLDAVLPPLRCFVLPGGSVAAATAHVARTLCRRAERRVVALCHHAGETSYDTVLQYLNRLSDYLFVLARHLAVVGRGEDYVKAE